MTSLQRIAKGGALASIVWLRCAGRAIRRVPTERRAIRVPSENGAANRGPLRIDRARCGRSRARGDSFPPLRARAQAWSLCLGITEAITLVRDSMSGQWHALRFRLPAMKESAVQEERRLWSLAYGGDWACALGDARSLRRVCSRIAESTADEKAGRARAIAALANKDFRAASRLWDELVTELRRAGRPQTGATVRA